MTPPQVLATRGRMLGGCSIPQRAARVFAVETSLNPLVASVKPSKTMALTDLASSMKEDGIDVISLSVGQPDFPTPAAVCDAAKAAIESGQTKYTPNTGTSSLRAAICHKLFTDNSLSYTPNEVVVTNGAKQAIWQAILACVSPGDEVVVPAPYWAAAEAALALGPAGGQPVKEMVTAFEKRRDFVMERLQAIQGLTIAQPQGAFYVLPDMSAYFGDGVYAEGFGDVGDADTLARYLLEVGRVALVPGDAFGVPKCVRFSYAASMETLDHALDRVEKALAALIVSR